MATRHQVRQSVVSLLYAMELNNENKDFIDEFLEERKIRNDQKKFTISLYDGINSNLKNIDDVINSHLNEEVNKLGIIEKAILRLGTYEILHTDTDKAIVINEAIELGKEMANDNSSKFINGVLDAITKDKR